MGFREATEEERVQVQVRLEEGGIDLVRQWRKSFPHLDRLVELAVAMQAGLAGLNDPKILALMMEVATSAAIFTTLMLEPQCQPPLGLEGDNR